MLGISQVLKLTALFEEHGSGVSWLDGCVEGFDGEYSRTTIAKELKALGLKRGKLTEKQVTSMRYNLCMCCPIPYLVANINAHQASKTSLISIVYT